mgnify:CR=1 FL=1
MIDMPKKPEHIPYQEEAQLMLDVVNFFIHKLPHALEMTAQHFDEAALASTFTSRMEDLSDDQLAGLGVHRDDIPVAAAAAAGLFRVANNAKSANK